MTNTDNIANIMFSQKKIIQKIHKMLDTKCRANQDLALYHCPHCSKSGFMHYSLNP